MVVETVMRARAIECGPDTSFKLQLCGYGRLGLPTSDLTQRRRRSAGVGIMIVCARALCVRVRVYADALCISHPLSALIVHTDQARVAGIVAISVDTTRKKWDSYQEPIHDPPGPPHADVTNAFWRFDPHQLEWRDLTAAANDSASPAAR